MTQEGIKGLNSAREKQKSLAWSPGLIPESSS